MVDTEFGYDKSRFPSLEGESFDCVICSEVVKNPKECGGCGSMFCSPCIGSWLQKKTECPNRCSPSDGGIKPIGKALMRMYNDLDIKCVHFDKCQKTVKMCDLAAHEKTCQLPQCANFELCGNLLQNGEPKNSACSKECLLIFKLKAANGDWKAIHSELKDFLGPYITLEPSKVSQPHHQHAKSESVVLTTSGPTVVSFKWDSKHCGSNIALTENGTNAYLKEQAYIFKTVLGDTGFMGGIHYWEIHADARTENELKIGVSTKKEFDPNSAFCDFEYGYAYYGLGQLRHNSNASGNAYGKKFKKEGALGICLNMNKGTLAFALDGNYFGVGYASDALKKGPIYPAVALLHSAGCKLVSGKPVPQYFMN